MDGGRGTAALGNRKEADNVLIPIAAVFIVLCAALMIVGVVVKSRRMLLLLDVLWWLMSLVSALFVGWAWKERALSENWAMLGFFFFSLPIIITTTIMAALLIVLAKLRKIYDIQMIKITLYVLIGFLIIQAIVGFLAGK